MPAWQLSRRRSRRRNSVLGAVGRALGELRERATALREAEFELSKLTERLEQRAAGLRFTSEGWRQRKPELEQLLAERPGLAEWLDDWFTAASSVQLEALDRLTDDVALPDSARPLADRLRTTRHAIAGRNWPQARLVLEAGVDGLDADRECSAHRRRSRRRNSRCGRGSAPRAPCRRLDLLPRAETRRRGVRRCGSSSSSPRTTRRRSSAKRWRQSRPTCASATDCS